MGPEYRTHAVQRPQGRCIPKPRGNSGYIATPEEYGSQQYEGASTLYGRLTFDAYQQIFEGLAFAMAGGQPAPSGPPPPHLGLLPQVELQSGVERDELLITETPDGFGKVLVQPDPEVSRTPGTRVRAVFRSGHPKNDLRRNDTYFRVERSVAGGSWTLVAWDATPETLLHWARSSDCPREPCYLSQTGVVWTVPPDAVPGSYRIRFFGTWKNGVTKELIPYEGTTDTFTVR